MRLWSEETSVQRKEKRHPDRIRNRRERERIHSREFVFDIIRVFICLLYNIRILSQLSIRFPSNPYSQIFFISIKFTGVHESEDVYRSEVFY